MTDVPADDLRRAKAANALGLTLLDSDPEQAAACFQSALQVDREAIALWLNLADALRRLNRSDAEIDALTEVLSRDPYQVAALVGKAYALERQGRLQESVATFGSLIKAYPLSDATPAAIRTAVDHGLALIAAHHTEAAQRLDPLISEALQTADPAEVKRAIHFANILFDRKKAYLPQPTGAYYPHLPAVEFFNREQFPWMCQLEAGTDDIASELRALWRAGSTMAVPYVQFAAHHPVNQWRELNHSPKWSAFFLVKDGRVEPQVAERCPRTIAIVSALPLMDTPGKAPTVLFSVLQPNTRIPPHTGTTNVRATIHLPLVVPPSCGFRVGSEIREWRYGEAWAFDDTIEHEAWNDSDQPRAILIVDAWNPFLSAAEREVVRITGV